MNSDEKECPYCFEVIKAKAVKCRYCGSVIEAEPPGVAAPIRALRAAHGCQLVAAEVDDLLQSLVDKSLVVFDEATGRYRLLETVRQYARDRLIESSDSKDLRSRHLAYFAALGDQAAPNLTGAEQQQWLERLEGEHDNIRTALEWSTWNEPETGLRLAAAATQLWNVHGHFQEGRSLLAELLSRSGSGRRTKNLARALNSAGALAYNQGDYAAAGALFKECLQVWKEIGDRRGIAASLNNLGNVTNELGDYDAARASYELCMQIWREIGDRLGIAASLTNLGYIANETGDYGAARGAFDESLQIRKELGDLQGVAWSLNALAGVAFDEGRYAAARALNKEGLQIHMGLGDRRAIAHSLEGLAAAQTDKVRSACLWGAAERLRKEVGTPIRPTDLQRYKRRVAEARSALGNDEAFDAAWAEGRAMTVERAVEYALEMAAN